MFMFNFTAMRDVSKYVRYGLLSMTRMPAYFHGKELGKRLPTTEGSGWTPDKKFSILRNAELRDVLRINIGNPRLRHSLFCYGPWTR